MVPFSLPQLSFRNQLFAFFLVLIFSFVSISSQTIIKEKVIINPNVKSLQLQKSSAAYNPILFGFGGMRPFTFSITGPAGSGGGSNGGYGAPASEVYVPAAYGEYHVVVTTNFLDSYSNVGYYAVWQNSSGTTQWVAGYDMWFYPDRGITVKEDRFTFNMIPPPPPPTQDNIKISMAGAKNIWPELPSAQSHIAGYNPRTNITVKATNGNQPLANQKVKISITRIEGTGGHDHPNLLAQSLWGRITVNGVNENSVTAFTNQNGEITTEEILASVFGGEYIIEAALESKPTVRDTVHILVRVPRLTLLAESIHYYKTGGTSFHHGPRIDTLYANARTPDNNHWGQEKLINSIEIIANKFNQDYPNFELLINDMSLPLGGGFDINGKWIDDIDIRCKEKGHGHCGHRFGKNADISYKVKQNGVEELVLLTKSKLGRLILNALRDIIEDNYGKPFPHSDHYHLQ